MTSTSSIDMDISLSNFPSAPLVVVNDQPKSSVIDPAQQKSILRTIKKNDPRNLFAIETVKLTQEQIRRDNFTLKGSTTNYSFGFFIG